MGAEDMERQSLNVFRMQLLGATVRRVDSGSRTLKDAINEAMRDWVATVSDSYYLLGSVLGPHPYPLMVREFQSVIGQEARAQCLGAIGRLPDRDHRLRRWRQQCDGHLRRVRHRYLRAVDWRRGRRTRDPQPGQHAARFAGGSAGVLQGTHTYVLQDGNGNIELTHSISAGLDYAAVGPEHAWLHDRHRAEIRVGERRRGARGLSAARENGGHPARSGVAHAVAFACRVAPAMAGDQILLVNLSGRGDKDVLSAEGHGAVMTSRIDGLRTIREQGRGGLVTYLTAGDPTPIRSAELLRAVADAGADVLEGCAVLDPLADGPAIQRATERALAQGMTLRGTLDIVRRTRAAVDAPIVLFTYANPILRMGVQHRDAADAGAGSTGCSCSTIQSRKRFSLRAPIMDAGLDPIFLVSPTTTDERIRQSAELGRGFLYLISRLGVTGVRDSFDNGVEGVARRVRKSSALPLADRVWYFHPEHVSTPLPGRRRRRRCAPRAGRRGAWSERRRRAARG